MRPEYTVAITPRGRAIQRSGAVRTVWQSRPGITLRLHNTRAQILAHVYHTAPLLDPAEQRLLADRP